MLLIMNLPGNVINEYIDRLPPETALDFVFADLFSRGSLLVDTLEERPRDQGSENSDSSGVSGPSLEAYTTGVYEPELDIRTTDGLEEKPAQSFRTVTVENLQRSFPRHLFTLTQEGPVGDNASVVDIPLLVAACRDYSLSMSSYFIQKRRNDEIAYGIEPITELQTSNGHDAAYDHEKPYIGVTVDEATTTLAELDDYDKKRLRIVTNAIDLGMVRTELLNQGADFYEMFGIKKPPQLKRQFSLRGIFAR